MFIYYYLPWFFGVTGLSVLCSCSQMEAGTNGSEVQDGVCIYMSGTFAGSAETAKTDWACLALHVPSLSWATLGLLKAGDLRIVRFLTLAGFPQSENSKRPR